jgi:hypothetical protein
MKPYDFNIISSAIAGKYKIRILEVIIDLAWYP